MQCCAASTACQSAAAPLGTHAHERSARWPQLPRPSDSSAVQAEEAATGLSEAEARVEDNVPARNPRTAVHADSLNALQRSRMRDRLAALARDLPGAVLRTYASAAMACAGVPVCGHGMHSVYRTAARPRSAPPRTSAPPRPRRCAPAPPPPRRPLPVMPSDTMPAAVHSE
jgi:hypothetical protein